MPMLGVPSLVEKFLSPCGRSSELLSIAVELQRLNGSLPGDAGKLLDRPSHKFGRRPQAELQRRGRLRLGTNVEIGGTA